MSRSSASREFETLSLRSGDAELILVPELGAGIVALACGGRHILRPYQGREAPHPFDLAAIILAPFSNRIAGGEFIWNGIRHSVPRNVPGEPVPIHGDAFQKAWHIAEHSMSHARLDLANGQIGPFHYAARQDVHLTARALTLDISLVNHGDVALPFGLGFHPWFPRTPATRLTFGAQSIWLNDERTLPREQIAIAAKPEWDFRVAKQLPAGLIDNAFTGWDGAAAIAQGPEHVSARLSADRVLSTALVFSPGQDADYFCFEPVSHPINAHNLPGHPGLRLLEPGGVLRASMTLEWDAP